MLESSKTDSNRASISPYGYHWENANSSRSQSYMRWLQRLQGILDIFFNMGDFYQMLEKRYPLLEKDTPMSKCK